MNSLFVVALPAALARGFFTMSGPAVAAVGRLNPRKVAAGLPVLNRASTAR